MSAQHEGLYKKYSALSYEESLNAIAEKDNGDIEVVIVAQVHLVRHHAAEKLSMQVIEVAGEALMHESIAAQREVFSGKDSGGSILLDTLLRTTAITTWYLTMFSSAKRCPLEKFHH